MHAVFDPYTSIKLGKRKKKKKSLLRAFFVPEVPRVSGADGCFPHRIYDIFSLFHFSLCFFFFKVIVAF
jgi:hypothetical protein